MKPITRQELAEQLSISRVTLYRWLKKEKIDIPSGLISPANQFKIFKKLGFNKGQLRDESK